MSDVKVTKADLVHVQRVVGIIVWLLDEYPEMLKEEDEDELKIVRQWLQEKLA